MTEPSGPMTLDELLAIAARAYVDGYLPHAGQGDSLGAFIRSELVETFGRRVPRDQQLSTAERVMRTATEEIQAVRVAFSSAERGGV